MVLFDEFIDGSFFGLVSICCKAVYLLSYPGIATFLMLKLCEVRANIPDGQRSPEHQLWRLSRSATVDLSVDNPGVFPILRCLFDCVLWLFPSEGKDAGEAFLYTTEYHVGNFLEWLFDMGSIDEGSTLGGRPRTLSSFLMASRALSRHCRISSSLPASM